MLPAVKRRERPYLAGRLPCLGFCCLMSRQTCDTVHNVNLIGRMVSDLWPIIIIIRLTYREITCCFFFYIYLKLVSMNMK